MPNRRSWDKHHHHSFLPNHIEDNLSDVYLPNFSEPFVNFVSIHEVDFEKNLSNIKETIPLNISIKPRIVEIYTLERLVLHLRSEFIEPFSMSFGMYLTGIMKKL